MPYINVRIAAPSSTTTAQQVTDLLTNLAVTTLGKAEPVIAVDIQFADPENWFIGGKSSASQHQATFFIEINVTTGTNTRDEKANFIKLAYAGMQQILGSVSPTSYVITKNVAPDDWGFGGLTQGYRYIEGQIK
ncbi:tautomerase family protein [Lactiplantibacillus herbarum]|uniref:tautomerase family protein n=1 Tax=Lactiplantibacillus herbarum TaxID=1670446 RepID=UPI00064E158A|nr:tautomerase family protein [Lactiplantibacillus herbarum]